MPWAPANRTCHCCCCAGDVRSSWPDVLNVTANFTGSPIPGCFAAGTPITFDLQRQECPTTLLAQNVTLQRENGFDPDGFPIYEEHIAKIPVPCEFISRSVNVGSCSPARFGIGPFWFPSEADPEQADHVPALWLIHGSGAVSFRLIEGTPLLKKTTALAPCSPQVVVSLMDAFGFPVTSFQAPITDSWSTIAAAVVSNGLASECDLFWVESFANGWDIATLVPITSNGTTLAVSSLNGAACDPTDHNTVHAQPFNSRFHGGEVKWVPYNDTFTPTQTASYSSAYGFVLRYVEYPGQYFGPLLTAGSSYYFPPPNPPVSFFHGCAPFAAIAKPRLGTGSGTSFLPGLTLKATILAPVATPLHPKPFPEAIGETACSDCGTMVVTPTIPTKNGVPVTGYNVNSRKVTLADCPPCSGGTGTPAERNATGASYDTREIVHAAISAMTVKRQYRLTLPASPPATFTLTINSQTTAPISASASASTIVTALEALAAVIPGDVVCTGGPLPAEVLLTWQGQFDTPATITFSGNAGIVVALLVRRDDVARFTSDDPVDTNYPTPVGNPGDHLSHTKTTAVLTTPASTKFVTVKDDDPEPPLAFPDGANLAKSNCLAQYRNVPYEEIVALVKTISYPGGVTNDLFSPLDLIGTATAPIETSGSSVPPTEFRIGLGYGSFTVGTGQPGGGGGLVYRGVPLTRLIGQRYFSASGSTLRTMRILALIATPLFSGGEIQTPHDVIDSVTIHTDSEMVKLGEAIFHAIGGFADLRHGEMAFTPVPPITLIGETAPWLQVFGRWNVANKAGPSGALSRTTTTNDCVGLTCSPTLYDRAMGFTDVPIFAVPGNPGGTHIVTANSSGAASGAYQDMEYGQFEVKSSVLTMNCCEGWLECAITYWVYYVRRDHANFHVDYTSPAWTPPAPPPIPLPLQTIVFDDQWYFQYGFIEARRAVFRANIQTDLALRPNIAKNRVVNLPFVSDAAVDFSQSDFIGVWGNPSDLYHGGRVFLRSSVGVVGSPTIVVNIPPLGTWSNFTDPIRNCSDYCNQFGINTGATSANADGSVTTINSRTESYGPMPHPDAIATPAVVDWTTATVDVWLDQLIGAHDVTGCSPSFRYSLPPSFPSDWSGEHLLLADSHEPNWIEELTSAPFVKAILSPLDWTLTLFAEKCPTQTVGLIPKAIPAATVRIEPRRVVARYRLPCNQRRRFDCNGANVLELVSCDRTVADWPLTLTVQP